MDKEVTLDALNFNDFQQYGNNTFRQHHFIVVHEVPL